MLCLTFLPAISTAAQVDADMVAKRRLFAPMGPGLKQIREGADGKIYVLASPSPGLVVYSPEARRLLTMREASALPEAALAEAKASGEVLVQYGEDCDVDGEGTIYVVDRGANTVQVYSKDAKHLRTININAPLAVAALPEGEVAVATMDEVEKLSALSGDEAKMDFAKDESHLFFQVGHRLLISRILTGQFPNYEAVLPRDNNKSVVLERVELSDAVRRVSQLADQRSHAVKLAVSNEGVEISASSPEYGEARESIEKEYKGDPIAIGFNSSYVLDFLAAAAEGPISIELKDEQSAGQMRPLADESYRYRYIIMPMRI